MSIASPVLREIARPLLQRGQALARQAGEVGSSPQPVAAADKVLGVMESEQVPLRRRLPVLRILADQASRLPAGPAESSGAGGRQDLQWEVAGRVAAAASQLAGDVGSGRQPLADADGLLELVGRLPPSLQFQPLQALAAQVGRLPSGRSQRPDNYSMDGVQRYVAAGVAQAASGLPQAQRDALQATMRAPYTELQGGFF